MCICLVDCNMRLASRRRDVAAMTTRIWLYIYDIGYIYIYVWLRVCVHDDLVAGCLTRRFTSPSGSFFIRDQASILDILLTSRLFTSSSWSPARKAPVFSAAPPIAKTQSPKKKEKKGTINKDHDSLHYIESCTRHIGRKREREERKDRVLSWFDIRSTYQWISS